MIAARIGRAWRRLATALCFACFGLLALGFGLVLCSCVAWTWLGRRPALRDRAGDEVGA